MDAVVAHPRSGTTFVTELLDPTGEACAHEYLAKLSSAAVPLPTAFYEGRATREDVRRLLERYEQPPASHVRIDSNWKLTWILPVFLETFPDARVVHLVRDPRDVVRSCLALDFYGNLREHPDFHGDHVRNAWLEHMPAVRRDDWATLSRLEKNCAFWVESQRLAVEALAQHRHSLCTRFEDLLRDDVSVARLFDFLDLPPPDAARLEALRAERINARTDVKRRVAAHRGIVPHFSEWSPGDRATLVDLCGETARVLGYELASP